MMIQVIEKNKSNDKNINTNDNDVDDNITIMLAGAIQDFFLIYWLHHELSPICMFTCIIM